MISVGTPPETDIRLPLQEVLLRALSVGADTTIRSLLSEHLRRALNRSYSGQKNNEKQACIIRITRLNHSAISAYRPLPKIDYVPVALGLISAISNIFHPSQLTESWRSYFGDQPSQYVSQASSPCDRLFMQCLNKELIAQS